MKKKARKFSAKDDRQAGHIADSEIARGKTAKEARAIGYATVSKNKSRKPKKAGRIARY